MFFVLPLLLGLLLALVHAFLRRRRMDRAGVLDLLLCYLLVFGWFLSGLVGFMGHAFAPDKVAAGIGWPAHPQFQFELAAFEIGIALAALLGLWIRDPRYWLGLSLPPSVFFLLAAAQHVKELTARGNAAAFNVLAIIPDVLLPVLFLSLLAWRLSLKRTP